MPPVKKASVGTKRIRVLSLLQRKRPVTALDSCRKWLSALPRSIGSLNWSSSACPSSITWSASAETETMGGAVRSVLVAAVNVAV